MPVDCTPNTRRNLLILRDDQLAAMFDEIQTESTVDQIGWPGFGRPYKRVTVSLTILAFDDLELVEILRVGQEKRFEIPLIGSVHCGSVLPFERPSHFRGTHAGDDEAAFDQCLSQCHGVAIRRIARWKWRLVNLVTSLQLSNFVRFRKPGKGHKGEGIHRKEKEEDSL